MLKIDKNILVAVKSSKYKPKQIPIIPKGEYTKVY
jgi:hypothetical protein